jgi:hypothetical protein
MKKIRKKSTKLKASAQDQTTGNVSGRKIPDDK